jgi:putative hydrolase of the HAD superfamily
MIDLNRERCVKRFETLGLKDANEMLGLYRQQPPFLLLETGAITSGEFFDELRSRMGRQISDREIEDAFWEFLVALPTERLAELRRMREAGYRLYMLSNTNAVMYNGWIQRAFEQEGLHVNDYFDGIITSFAEGVCKPDHKIFSTVLDRYRLDGEETVMLDDSKANCEAAEAVGMRSLVIGSEQTPTLQAAMNLIEEWNH